MGNNDQDGLEAFFAAVATAGETDSGHGNAAETAQPQAVPGDRSDVANIWAHVPWWAWLSVGASLFALFMVVMFIPSFRLSVLTSRLGDDHVASQSAMRQLMLRNDGQTVNKLFDLAASQNGGMAARLRAIDTLGLIQDGSADRALQRLEYGNTVDAMVREHAAATRKQHGASASEVRRNK